VKCIGFSLYQVRGRIGSPITGYGQESRNRAARQRIPNRVWTDEEGVEHVEVNLLTCNQICLQKHTYFRINILNRPITPGFRRPFRKEGRDNYIKGKERRVVLGELNWMDTLFVLFLGYLNS